MTGCTVLIQLRRQRKRTATTVVDAVEGDKSAEESSGIIDTLRGRTDPIAGDPAWAPINPKENQSIMQRQQVLCLILTILAACTMIQNRVALVTLLP